MAFRIREGGDCHVRHVCQMSFIASATMLSLSSSFVVLAGMGSGGYFSLQSSIVAQIVGSHRVGPAIGAIELVSSIGAPLFSGLSD